jgi:acetyl-CoA carboxylase biotin carboxyl carrier protein
VWTVQGGGGDVGLSHDDVMEILRLIDASHFGEMQLQLGDLKLTVRKGSGSGGDVVADGAALAVAAPTATAPVVPAAPAAPAAAPGQAPAPAAAAPARLDHAAPVAGGEVIPEGLVAVRAPMLGTFYRAPSPGAPPFAEVGATVGPEDTVGLIEVMKLFNALPAGVAGRVEAFLAEDGAMVEYGQALLLIRPES